jgi:methyl-accepting chemotaxis protein
MRRRTRRVPSVASRPDFTDNKESHATFNKHCFPVSLSGLFAEFEMFNLQSKAKLQSALAQTAAINQSQAVIEFGLDGTIITANENFLKAFGYSLEEIRGKHHGMFLEAAARTSPAYREFWASLNRGEFQAGQYKRIDKDGREIWIQASYNPILDARGKPIKVIKFATDITAQKFRATEDAGKIAAIGRAQAVIEFSMDGTIVTANDNFLKTMGYSLAEVQGKHHSLFVIPEDRDSTAYREFWARLNRGDYQAGEYKRIGKTVRKSGFSRPIIRSSMNPASRSRSSNLPPTSPAKS